VNIVLRIKEISSCDGGTVEEGSANLLAMTAGAIGGGS